MNLSLPEFAPASGRLGTSGARARQKAWEAYHANPNICEHCKQPIKAHPGEKIKEVRGKKHCSYACAGAAKTARRRDLDVVEAEEYIKSPALCIQCSSAIELRPGDRAAKTRQRKFCSVLCCRKHTARVRSPKLLPDGLCDFCEAPISHSRKFCGDNCADKMKRRAGIKSGPRSHKKVRNRLKQRALEYAGGVCSECGYERCRGALHFHHLDPSLKEFTVGSFKGGWEALRKEIDKCVILCANCHAEVHDGMRILHMPELDDFGFPIAA